MYLNFLMFAGRESSWPSLLERKMMLGKRYKIRICSQWPDLEEYRDVYTLFLFYSAVASVIAVHNIPCNWRRGAVVYAVVEMWRLQTGHWSTISEATQNSHEELSPSWSRFWQFVHLSCKSMANFLLKLKTTPTWICFDVF